jgi:Ni,Fe-hydrogenase III component G
MANEEAIKQELTGKFAFLGDKITVRRERRIFVETSPDTFRQVFEYAVRKMGFEHLCTITGLDEGENLAFVYHVSRPDGTVLNVRNRVPKANPVTQTITEFFPGGILYERELIDLLGAKVEGLPPGKRYPLPDGWPENQYPLRKDWKADMLRSSDGRKEEEKNG